MDLYSFLGKLENELSLSEAEKRYSPKQPGKDISAEKKGEYVKRAKKGEDLGAPGKTFKGIEASAAKRYGSKEAGKKVAGSIFWKKAKAGTL